MREEKENRQLGSIEQSVAALIELFGIVEEADLTGQEDLIGEEEIDVCRVLSRSCWKAGNN